MRTTEHLAPGLAHQALADIALSQVGVREVGRNGGAAVRRYQSATDLPPGNWPWCAAFVCWVIQQWLLHPGVVEWLDLKTTTPEKWRPRTARAYGFLDWAKARPRTCTIIGPRDRALVGDIVVYDFSHIGIVTAYNGNSINPVEGNTNAMGSREGDGVWCKSRQVNLVRAYIRIGGRK
jgi:hypothetical protein